MSITVKVCTTIDAPPDTVWSAVENIESHTEWMKDAVRITFKSEQHSGIGAEFECLTRIGPLFTTDRFVVTQWRPGELMGIEHRGAVKGDAEFRLEPEGAGRTRFCWEERLRFPWWLGSVVGERVGGPVLQHLWSGNVARLKASIEEARERRRSWPSTQRRERKTGMTSPTLPTIEGPITGGNGAFLGGGTAGVAEHDYTQTEYFITGRADAYELGSDGLAKAVDTADYRTRILVHRPADAARFNGTVVVEWLNVSGGVDGCPDWTFLHREMMRSGYAWVGVSAQSVGVHGGPAIMETAGPMNLIAVDPERYGSLSHPGDTFSFDMYSQAGAVARGAAGTVLAELTVERVIAIGESQSAFRLTTYVNVVDPVTPVYDGFFVHARGGSGSPLDASGPVRDASAPPEPFRADLRVPVLCFEAETDLMVLDYLPARQPDNDKFRLWEVAGTAHADVYTFVAGFIDSGTLPIAELAAAWKPTTAPLGMELEQPLNAGPQHYVLQAALAHFDRWLRDGTPPPRAPRLEVRDGDPTHFVVDDHGNPRGGIRTPHVDVPVAVLSGMGNDGAAIARLCGTTVPFSAEQLASLYSSKADYCAQFDAATDAAVAAGWFLEADAPEIKAIAAELYPAP